MFKKKTLAIGVLSLVAAILAVGLAVPAYADTTTTTTNKTTTPKPASHAVEGIVTGVTGTTSFTIKNAGQQAITINVDSNTKYYLISLAGIKDEVQNEVTNSLKDNKNLSTDAVMKELHIPANWKDNLGWLDTFSKNASFSDIAVNDRVVARVDASNLASQILIIKVPQIKQAKGIVTVSGTTITIAADDGTTVGPLTWGADTEFIIKGVASVPSGQYGVVTYNSGTDVVSLVNFATKPPATTPPVVSPTTTSS